MAIKGKGVTILIVDDNVDFHTIATALFRRLGYSVKSLFVGDTLLVLSMAASCDIVLVDVDLPGDSGVDICQSIKADPRTAGIPVILISGNADIEILCPLSKSDACLLKPFSSTEIAAQVKKLLAKAIETEH